ncbi:hypothetical protein E5288_WYG007813 [Bos mutus]|uniref:Uncharacterized protein n=1 Tax=Bos mutus TaxID=72004 RepID=A0A6B0RII2_9CETA|nr:hypothetical protein [Bos mutus]
MPLALPSVDGHSQMGPSDHSWPRKTPRPHKVRAVLVVQVPLGTARSPDFLTPGLIICFWGPARQVPRA